MWYIACVLCQLAAPGLEWNWCLGISSTHYTDSNCNMLTWTMKIITFLSDNPSPYSCTFSTVLSTEWGTINFLTLQALQLMISIQYVHTLRPNFNIILLYYLLHRQVLLWSFSIKTFCPLLNFHPCQKCRLPQILHFVLGSPICSGGDVMADLTNVHFATDARAL
jgi:hypothetical protein